MSPEVYAEVLRTITVTPDTPPANAATCGECGFAWDDTISTELTPAPAGRCPNEYNHSDIPPVQSFTIRDDALHERLTMPDAMTQTGETTMQLANVYIAHEFPSCIHVAVEGAKSERSAVALSRRFADEHYGNATGHYVSSGGSVRNGEVTLTYVYPNPDYRD